MFLEVTLAILVKKLSRGKNNIEFSRPVRPVFLLPFWYCRRKRTRPAAWALTTKTSELRKDEYHEQ